jgi:uracil phosphoribosyltransferase
MLNSALRLFPRADVAFVGLRRVEGGGAASIYLNTIPSRLDGRPAFLLEPMIATGGSAVTACNLLAAAGAGNVVVVSAVATDVGIARVTRSDANPNVVTASIDAELNADAFIVPGLGDAGDRQFGHA